MRSRLVALAVSAVALLAWTDAEACGDKFLVIGRGVRYQHVRATHPASILIYANPRSHAPAAARELQLESNLKLAGHRPQEVTDAGALEAALRSGGHDLVLSDLADAAALVEWAQAAPSRPMIVPILYKPSQEEQAAARRQFPFLIQAPGKSKAFLGVIDDAMELKLRAAKGK